MYSTNLRELRRFCHSKERQKLSNILQTAAKPLKSMAFRKYDYTFDFFFFQPVRPVLYCSKKTSWQQRQQTRLVQNKTLEFYKGIALHRLTK